MARKITAVKPGDVPEDGRVARGTRTRAAIVDAAAAMLAAGKRVTVDDVSSKANVSRRTVYTYFPTVEQLVLDASAGSLANVRIDVALERHQDAETRVAALARAIVAMSTDAMPMGRALIRLTVEPAQPVRGVRVPRRGYRRIAWIERALEPLRSDLSPARFRRLVSALCVVMGFEAMVALEDIVGVSAREEADICEWMARAIVYAATTMDRPCK